MKPRRTASALLVAPLIAACFLPAVRAEVSADRTANHRPRVLLLDRVLGITDGADPVPHVTWEPFRPVEPGCMLNPMGAFRPDGRPSVVFFPATGLPWVVWAYNNGTDHDIAYAQWQNGAWGPVRFVTSGLEDEIDPRAFVTANGTLHVVWWVNPADGANPMVMWTRLSPIDALWSVPVRVTEPEEAASSPTVLSVDGVLRIAYEEGNLDSSVGTTRRIVIRRRDTGNAFDVEHVIPTARSEALEPLLHARGASVWIDWKHAGDALAYSRFSAGTWSLPSTVPWEDPSWVGVEDGRRTILRQVVSSDPDTQPIYPAN